MNIILYVNHYILDNLDDGRAASASKFSRDKEDVMIIVDHKHVHFKKDEIVVWPPAKPKGYEG